MSPNLETEGVMFSAVRAHAPQVGCEVEGKEKFWSEVDGVSSEMKERCDDEVLGRFGIQARNAERKMVV